MGINEVILKVIDDQVIESYGLMKKAKYRGAVSYIANDFLIPTSYVARFFSVVNGTVIKSRTMFLQYYFVKEEYDELKQKIENIINSKPLLN